MCSVAATMAVCQSWRGFGRAFGLGIAGCGLRIAPIGLRPKKSEVPSPTAIRNPQPAIRNLKSAIRSRFDEFEHAGFFGALALIFVEDLFAQAQVFGSGFDVFVDVDILEGAFQAEFERSIELDACLRPGNACWSISFPSL